MRRRILNVSIASIALIALAVPLLLVGLLIRLTSHGPALFRQQRVGKLGRPFDILKFRTMTAGTSDLSAITIGKDKRTTPIGLLLRKTKIDELPQLINVLKGDMNVVGPRPELPEFVDTYSAADRTLILSVEPGITDFASIRYRNENELLAGVEHPLQYYREVLIPHKLRYARFYVRRSSMALDLYVICLTARSLIRDASSQTKRARPHLARSPTKCSPSPLLRTP